MTGIKIKPKVYLKSGTMVKVTKLASLVEGVSKVKVASVNYGNLIEDLQVGNIIDLTKISFNTSGVESVMTTEAGDFIVGTRTSVYFVQRI